MDLSLRGVYVATGVCALSIKMTGRCRSHQQSPKPLDCFPHFSTGEAMTFFGRL